MPRLRLAILGDSPCDLCTAACCKQNGHDYAVLLEGEQERRRFGPFSVDITVSAGRSSSLERVLPYVDGRCRFLGADDRCTIYEDRPVNCRRFECVTGYNHAGSSAGRHSLFLARNEGVLRMLQSLTDKAEGSKSAAKLGLT